MAKDAYYFPHDANARNDEKILELRSEFGAEGYGVYWMLIEMMREESEYKLSLLKLSGISLACAIDRKKLTDIIVFCVSEEIGLFVSADDFFWSESLLRRMEKVDELRAKRSEWGKQGAQAKHKPSTSQASVKQTKLNQTKLNQTKDIKKPPSFSQILDYIQEKSLNVNGKDFFNYYTADSDPRKHWIDAKGNRVKSWKQKILTWNMHNKDKNKDKIERVVPKIVLCGAEGEPEDGLRVVCISDKGHPRGHQWSKTDELIKTA